MDLNQIIVFDLENKLYSIEISYVMDVYEHMESVRVPNSDDYIEGIINLRGNVITLINLKKRLKIDRNKKEKNVIICEFNKEKFGLTVDEIIGIENIDKAVDTDYDSGFVKGFIERDNREIMIIDLGRIITKT